MSTLLVPKDLNWFEKQRRLEVAKEMLSLTDNDLKCILIGDETWIFAYEPTTALHSSKCRAAGKNTSKQLKNQGPVECFLRLPWRCPQKIPSNFPNR